MSNSLNALAEVLEGEIALGETLRANLEAQKRALVAWDITDLLARIEAREVSLRSLGELEQRREQVLEQCGALAAAPRLRQVITQLPQALPARVRLSRLHEQTRKTFLRLRADEQQLHGLMGNLVGLIQEALSPLVQPALSTYGESGAAERQRSASALLQSKV